MSILEPLIQQLRGLMPHFRVNLSSSTIGLPLDKLSGLRYRPKLHTATMTGPNSLGLQHFPQGSEGRQRDNAESDR